MWMPNVLPTEELRDEMGSIVHRLYGINKSDLHVFGMPVMNSVCFYLLLILKFLMRIRSFQDKFDGVDLVLFDIIPSFTLSYAIFAFNALKVKIDYYFPFYACRKRNKTCSDSNSLICSRSNDQFKIRANAKALLSHSNRPSQNHHELRTNYKYA